MTLTGAETPPRRVVHSSGCRAVAPLLLALLSARLWAATYTAPPNQVNLRIPPVGTGGSGDTNQDVTRSTIIVSGFDTNRWVDNVRVAFSLGHTCDGDLVIALIGPTGSRLLLANRLGGSGQNFTNTEFSRYGKSILLASPPFSGIYYTNLS